MDSLVTHVIAWPTVLVALLMFGFAPGAALRVIVLAYRRDDPRRTELLGELPNVPRVERPFWVCEQLEEALFEGLAGRLAALIGRVRNGRRGPFLPGQPSGGEGVSRYLDLLEGFVAVLADFESRKGDRQAIPYRRVWLAAGNRCLPGSVYWMAVAGHADLEQGARVELNEHPGLRGVVTALSGNDICVRFEAPVAHGRISAIGTLRRTHDYPLYRMQREAIARLREGNAVNPQLIRVLADCAFLPLGSHSPPPTGMSRLDRDQWVAVARACQVQDFLLVTSPPGTGRIHTASKMISQCVQRGERVLVVGPTNMGVDSLLSALPRNLTKIRVAKPNSLSISPSDLRALNVSVVDLESAPTEIAVEQPDVVAGTPAGVALSGITVGRAFDLLVIIDAERVSLPSAIVPLASAGRAVLMGDPSQLPLFVDPEMHDWVSRLTGGAEQSRPGVTMETLLTTSLFELLLAKTPSSNKVVLTTQYRMPSTVADFISHNFYERTLVSPARDQGKISMSRSLLPQPFTIVDTSCLPTYRRGERLHVRSGQGSGYVNLIEADIIAAIVTAEARRGRDWAVAVPYAAQANLIRKLLRKTLGPAPGDLEAIVGTIDKFSGVEHDLVIVGCTRSNRSGSVGFLRDVRRMNVAMTRARGQFVVVGDMQTLTSARDLPVRALMSAMVAHVQRRGEIVPANEITGRLR